MEVRARVSDRLPAGIVHLDTHWPTVPVGRLVGDATEGNTGAPEFKHIAVSITKVDTVEQAAD